MRNDKRRICKSVSTRAYLSREMKAAVTVKKKQKLKLSALYIKRTLLFSPLPFLLNSSFQATCNSNIGTAYCCLVGCRPAKERQNNPRILQVGGAPPILLGGEVRFLCCPCPLHLASIDRRISSIRNKKWSDQRKCQRTRMVRRVTGSGGVLGEQIPGKRTVQGSAAVSALSQEVCLTWTWKGVFYRLEIDGW